MTCRNDDDSVVSELRVRVHDDDDVDKSGYMRLRGNDADDEAERFLLDGGVEKPGCGFFCCKLRWSVVWYWVKLATLFALLGALAFVVFKWVGPFFMDNGIIPIINWETSTFTTPQLGLMVFLSVALFPVLLLPSSPSMWIAGMTFGYAYGFLLVTVALAVGISLPFCIGSLFLHKIRRRLEKYPKQAAILRAAGEGNWFHQFRSVALIRISPFPYILYNYCSVATHVKYGPYLLGSLVGMAPDTFLTLYTGVIIQTLADASQEHHNLSAPQIAFNVVGFCCTAATAVFFTLYAKRRLKTLPEEPLLS
ncbi:TVP38/TMEM64 family membrane protein slr0305 [Linum grandiflorum]